jgi:hypothetical protein
MDAWRDGDGRLHTVLRGADACPEAATRLGYARDGAGRWLREGGPPPFGAVLRLFPLADVVEVGQGDVLLPPDAPFDPARPAGFREARLAADGFDPAGFRAHLMAEGIPGEYRRAFEAAAAALLGTLGRGRFLAAARGDDPDVAAMLDAAGNGAASLAEAAARHFAPFAASHAPHLGANLAYLLERLGQGEEWLDRARGLLAAARSPAAAVSEFLHRGGAPVVAGPRGMLEYAAIHLREHQHRIDNDLPPRPPAGDVRALDRAWADLDAAFAARLAPLFRSPGGARTDFRKLGKLFGVPFLLEMLRDPAGRAEDVLGSPRTEHLSPTARENFRHMLSRLSAHRDACAAVAAAALPEERPGAGLAP